MESFPDLSHWFGGGYEQWMHTPNWILDIYIDAIPRLRRERLAQMVMASTAPWVGDEGARVIGDLLSESPHLEDDKKAMLTSMITVEYED